MNLELLDLRKKDLENQLAIQENLRKQSEIELENAKRNSDAIRGALQDVEWWREQLAISNGEAPIVEEVGYDS